MSELLTPRVVEAAVIPIAGIGTRMAPYTGSSPKFMAPIYAGTEARPNIEYTLDDCINAGVNRLVFVVSDGGDEALNSHIGPMSPDLEKRYRAVGKLKELEKEKLRRERFQDMSVTYVEQTADDPYGTAVPLSLAKKALEGVEYFAITGGDDFIWSPDGSSELTRQIEGWQQSNADGSIMGKPVPRAEGPKYGIVQVGENGLFAAIAEKPPLETLPDNPLANISRYIVSKAIWTPLAEVMATPRDPNQPEYYVTDVMNLAVEQGAQFVVHPVEGIYFDAGSPAGARHASDTISSYL